MERRELRHRRRRRSAPVRLGHGLGRPRAPQRDRALGVHRGRLPAGQLGLGPRHRRRRHRGDPRGGGGHPCAGPVLRRSAGQQRRAPARLRAPRASARRRPAAVDPGRHPAGGGHVRRVVGGRRPAGGRGAGADRRRPQRAGHRGRAHPAAPAADPQRGEWLERRHRHPGGHRGAGCGVRGPRRRRSLRVLPGRRCPPRARPRRAGRRGTRGRGRGCPQRRRRAAGSPSVAAASPPSAWP